MGIFAFGRRREARDTSSPTLVKSGLSSGALRFAGVGEALTAEQCPLAACEAVGKEMALDGASVTEALSGLEEIWALVAAGPPPFEATRSFMVAWGETVQSATNAISCEDPLTGLASAAHLRTELTALHERERARATPHSHALVIVELAVEGAPAAAPHPGSAVDHSFERAFRLVRARERITMVFACGETVARVGAARIVVVAERDEHLGRRVALLRKLIEDSSRIWIEPLPSNRPARDVLVDELSRL